MNTKEENSLELNAKHNIDICCETLCDKSLVVEYISTLEQEVKQLKDMIKILTEDYT
jgi:hypothetical protein